MNTTVAMIYCPSCGVKKPVEEFSVNGYRRKRICKACEFGRKHVS